MDLSFNELHSLSPQTVFDLPRLERLDMSDNRIGRVERQAIANLDKLRRLDFRGNRVQHVRTNKGESAFGPRTRVYLPWKRIGDALLFRGRM